MSLFVKKGDQVVVLSGEDKGVKAKVLQVSPKDNRVIVEGVNILSRHKKARSAQEAGGIVKSEGAIDASKVQVVCPACGDSTRIAVKVDAKGKKGRYCKNEKCGALIEVVSEKSDKKKAAKKAKADKATKEVKAEKAVKEVKTETEVKVKSKKKETATKE